MKPVHVVFFTLLHEQAVRDVLADLQQLCARQDQPRFPILLFCDLPDAACPKFPQEDGMIRTLYTGLKSMSAQIELPLDLLVRSRVWDDAERQYLGSSQPLSCRDAAAQLLIHGQTQAAFDMHSLPLSSLKGRWDAVLFSDASLFCAPDVPARMLGHLQKHSLHAVGAYVLPLSKRPQSALAWLCAAFPFSLSPLHTAQQASLAQRGQVSGEHPALYTLSALSCLHGDSSVSPAPGCAFVRRHAPDLPSVFCDFRRLCRMHPLLHAGVPLAQLILLAAAACFGYPLLAAAALIPELWALAYPRAWPGVLLRMALLPITALRALDALLCRLLARSPLLRLRVPRLLFSPLFFLFAALMLLIAAFISVYALAAVVPFAFLWLCMSVLYPALDQTEGGADAPAPA